MGTIRTGDALLFSSNTSTGFLLKTFITSRWNHAGIAVRIKRVMERNGYRHQVTLDDSGTLYILETNTEERFDEICGFRVVGVGFSRADVIFRNYNDITVRRLREDKRLPELSSYTLQFANAYRGKPFAKGFLKFLTPWLGIDLDSETDTMFCSELMASYYLNFFGSPQLPTETNIINVFGANAPEQINMFTPETYTVFQTPKTSIFETLEENVHLIYADLLYVILQPLVIIVFVIILIYMSLPREEGRQHPS